MSAETAATILSQLCCEKCGAALIPMLLFGEDEWRYHHPWPSACGEVGKPARKIPTVVLAKLTGTATSISCGECRAGLVPEMVSREVGWEYRHKAGGGEDGCKWSGKRFRVVGVELEVCDG